MAAINKQKNPTDFSITAYLTFPGSFEIFIKFYQVRS